MPNIKLFKIHKNYDSYDSDFSYEYLINNNVPWKEITNEDLNDLNKFIQKFNSDYNSGYKLLVMEEVCPTDDSFENYIKEAKDYLKKEEEKQKQYKLSQEKRLTKIKENKAKRDLIKLQKLKQQYESLIKNQEAK